jgi:hypothetical protein
MKTTTLTPIQKKALALMNERNLGAVNVRGEWVWPCDIRGNGLGISDEQAIAQAVIEILEARK